MSVPRYQATSVVDDNDNMWVFGGTYDDDLGKKNLFFKFIKFLGVLLRITFSHDC
jgi:hypothetical protein